MQNEMITQQDLDYLAQQSAGNVNMIIAGMTALMNDTDNKVSMMESQAWFQRMCRTISGKNKMTVQEIQQNHEKINLYMSQAMKHMYEQQMVDRQIVMSLGNQLNEIYQEHVQLKQMLGAFVSKLNEKIESIDNFHMLNTEIEQGLYSGYAPVVAVITILSQLDKRCIQDYRKMNILKNSMKGKGILRDAEMPLQEMMTSIVAIPQEMVGAIYIELNSIRGNYVADLFLRLIEGYHFLPDMVRKMKDRKSVIIGIIHDAQLDEDVTLSEQAIFDSLVESKLDLLEGFTPISEIYYDEKLNEAERLYISGHYDDAFELLKSLAEKGVSRAMYFMGEYYSHGHGNVEIDKKKAEHWRLKGHECGDALSSINAVWMKLVDLAEDNQIELFERIQKLAEQEDVVAQFEIADMYKNGYGCPQDSEKQIYWLSQASENGFVLGMKKLSDIYWDKNDYENTYKWYKKAAELGDAVSQNKLANLYYNGQGVEQGYEEAIKWYKLSAEQGYDWAQDNLANMYYGGKGVKQDYSEAAKWYRMAAEQGNSTSQNNIGNLYYWGKGVEKDFYEAVKWYRKAAEQGNMYAQNNLANCCKKGEGMPQDYAEAVKWYRKSAEQGYANAQNSLGLQYWKGNGIDKSQEEANKWFRKAAEQGNMYAQGNLADSYRDGDGVPQDYTEATKWYQKAAEQGYDYAQNQLGIRYSKGQGVNKSNAEASKWFRKAAEQNHGWAAYNLANNYRYGKGIDEDWSEADKWYRKAAELGVNEAEKERKAMWDSRVTIDGTKDSGKTDWGKFFGVTGWRDVEE